MKLAIHEILKRVSDQPTRQEKINTLRTFDNNTLRTILSYALDPRVKWLLPPGAPPFKYSEALEDHGMLYSQARKLYLFVEGGNPNINKLKRESLFIGLLESLAPGDADLVIAAKDKRIPYEGIDAQLVNEAFGMDIPVASMAAPQVSPGVKVNEPPAQPTPPEQPVKKGRGRPKGSKKTKKAADQQEVTQA